ncbi:periplasmic heavy metal sensor [Paroceanicella profunda]|uniref:periplasmic heavy metal sensor n=1 Tax=Paroceanicella profunda TaxID=2579971 RepID=UPI001478B807|nr:periplasmic heavy metal sensor [Paroceanicella profunda]
MPDPASPARSPRWVKLLLAVSLGTNLVVGGLVAGALLRPEHDRGTPFMAFNLRHALRNLPEADRAAFDAINDEMRADMKPLLERSRDDRDQLQEILRADDFDADAMRGILEHQSDAFGAMFRQGTERAVDVLAGMSPEARRRFADAMANPRRPPRGPDNPEHKPQE